MNALGRVCGARGSEDPGRLISTIHPQQAPVGKTGWLFSARGVSPCPHWERGGSGYLFLPASIATCPFYILVQVSKAEPSNLASLVAPMQPAASLAT